MVEFAGAGSKIYFNGQIVPEREATVHVLSVSHTKEATKTKT